jgi:hypothetical protein
MSNSTDCKPSVRPMHSWEIEQAKLVFGDHLDYERVRIHECNPWPDRVNRIGLWLKRLPDTGAHNAITLGNHCIFPVRLPVELVQPEQVEHYKICWLIHELTHAWQYQTLGWRYLILALKSQFKLKAGAYHYGGEKGLMQSFLEGKKLSDFNLEQQGDIAKDFYKQLSNKKPVKAWEPYIKEIQRVA